MFLAVGTLEIWCALPRNWSFPSCAFQSAMACGYTKPSIIEWPLSILEDFVWVEFRLHFPKFFSILLDEVVYILHSATRLASLNLEAWSVQSHAFQVLSENFFGCILHTLIFHSYSTYQRSLARSRFPSNMGGIIMIDTEAGRLNITNWLWIYMLQA